MGDQGIEKKTILADISLLFVAIFWGSNFVIMKHAFEVIEPFTYLGIRFCIAAVMLAVIFWKRLRKAPVGDYRAGLLIGLFLFTGYAFQTVGLLHTTPANSGFITGMAVIIVPFLYFFVTRHSPGWWAFLGAGLAAVGLYLLSAGETYGLGFGDLLTLVSAFLFAAHLIAIAIHVRQRDPIVLAVTQIAFTGLASFGTALIFESTSNMFIHPAMIWAAIFYAIIFCTIGAFVTQTLAQRYTPPTHAVLILSTEAVFAGIFSYFFWGEIFTLQKLSGALLILGGILITELRPVIMARYAARRAAMIRRGIPPLE
jgi:drug/metabolite transporter (DMT)-like permease